ncbi:MAG: prephenate dehydratase [Myxococcaceae bacterium]
MGKSSKSASGPNDLAKLRSEIEQVDRTLLTALLRRMELAEGVALAKLNSASPFRDPPREQHVLSRVNELARELGLDVHEVERLYRHIIDMAVARQQLHLRGLAEGPLRVAYQGIEASYSHLAAQARYAGRPGGVVLEGYETLREAVDAVRTGEAGLALLPIEHTTAGSMNETYDLLAEGRVAITGEVVSRVEHRLLVRSGTRFEDIQTVLSHPQAFAQCSGFVRGLKGVRLQPELDTAGAARKVAESRDAHLAAIASAQAAERYGLVVLPVPVQNAAGDFTRFVEVAAEPIPVPAEATCKTSLLMVLEHKAGALNEVLGHFARHGVSLAKIESRPIAGSPWRYRFYVDLEGHAASRAMTAALADVRKVTSEITILGTYPRALDTEAT